MSVPPVCAFAFVSVSADDEKKDLEDFLKQEKMPWNHWWQGPDSPLMKTWNIRVVDAQGHSLTQARALARYVLSWLWFLPPLLLTGVLGISGLEAVVIVLGWVLVWALLSRFHKLGQFVHDALAGTRLVSSEPLGR